MSLVSPFKVLIWLRCMTQVGEPAIQMGLEDQGETEPQPYPVVGVRVEGRTLLVTTEKHGQCWAPCSVEIAGQLAADGARGEGPLDFPAGRTLEADKGFMAVWHVGELLQRPLQKGWMGPV